MIGAEPGGANRVAPGAASGRSGPPPAVGRVTPAPAPPPPTEPTFNDIDCPIFNPVRKSDDTSSRPKRSIPFASASAAFSTSARHDLKSNASSRVLNPTPINA